MEATLFTSFHEMDSGCVLVIGAGACTQESWRELQVYDNEAATLRLNFAGRRGFSAHVKGYLGMSLRHVLLEEYSGRDTVLCAAMYLTTKEAQRMRNNTVTSA